MERWLVDRAHQSVHRGRERGTHEHSSDSSSHSSIFLNLESRNALMSAYSARPSRSG